MNTDFLYVIHAYAEPRLLKSKTVKFYFFKKISSPLFRCPGAVFFEGEKSRKVDSRFLHAVSLHRRSDGCGPSVVAPHDFIVRIKTINPLFFFNFNPFNSLCV